MFHGNPPRCGTVTWVTWVAWAAAAALTLGAAGPASASIVQFSFTGHITNGPGDFVDPGNFFQGLVGPGTTVHGAFTYDTAGAVDTIPGDPQRASYVPVV